MTDAQLVVTGLSGSALVQDNGRDLRASGVPVSGAFDRFAHLAATRLVGGGAQQAALEVVGALEVRPTVPVTVAATGGADLWIDGTAAPSWTAVGVAAGQRIVMRAAGSGYLAVAGGLQVDAVLGSRSSCLMGPLGPPPVRIGDRLPLAHPATAATVGDYCRPTPAAGAVRVVPGPHLVLSDVQVTVLATSRIGVRVRPARGVAAAADLPSLGVLPGTIQVLPAGDWFVLGPDAGTMGGYPVIGVVITADLDRWAQVQPGACVDLVVVGADAAPQPAAPQVVRVRHLPG